MSDPATSGKSVIDSIYDTLVGNRNGERVKKDIAEEAVRSVPQNFLRILFSLFSTKAGDALSKPGVILTWLLGTLGAPSSIIGLIVPIRESGSMLLQMFIGEWIGRFAIRRFFWVTGCLLQGVAILGMVPVAVYARGSTAGWWVVGLMVVFSLSRGVCSVVSKDVIGRTIPKTRRGRLSGMAASVSGVVAVGIGIWLLLTGQENLGVTTFGWILGIAGSLWLMAALVLAFLDEEPATIERGGAHPFREMWKSLSMLGDYPHFRLFCISRALMAGTVLSMPFYVILAREAIVGSGTGLGVMLIAGSVATALSGAVWGRLADRSSRVTLAVSGTFAGVVGLVAAAVSKLELASDVALYIYGVLFFLLGLAHTGIRQGRKTYLVDLADADNRATFVAVSNTVIGLVVLAGGTLGLLADLVGESWVITVFAVLGLAGGLLALRLPEVQD